MPTRVGLCPDSPGDVAARPWSHCSSVTYTTAVGVRHITCEFPAFGHYGLTVLSWTPGSSSRQITSRGAYWKKVNHHFGAALKPPGPLSL